MLGFCLKESFSTVLSVGAGDSVADGGCLVAAFVFCFVGESFLSSLLVAAEDGPFATGCFSIAVLVGCFLDGSSVIPFFADAGDDPFDADNSLVSFFSCTFLGAPLLGSLVSVFAGAGDGPFAIGGCSSLVDAVLLGSFVTVPRVGAGVVLCAGVEDGAMAGVFVGNGVVVGSGVVVGGAVVPPAHAGVFGTPM